MHGVRAEAPAVHSVLPTTDIRGQYALTLDKKDYVFEISGKIEKPTGKITTIKTTRDAKTQEEKSI